ncbi:putative DYW domain-containing protein [Helianthus annuus]|nr:putative DYW domain-containing protein [Helianthus annuus]
MNRKLHEYGHKPRTMEVLFDLEDEDGEDAFALIASELGSPIRIIKNLRVCVDCHDYTKLVSIIYKREIIVKRSESISLFSRWELFLFRLLVANCNAIRWLKNVDCATRRICTLCTIRFIHVVLFFCIWFFMAMVYIASVPSLIWLSSDESEEDLGFDIIREKP